MNQAHITQDVESERIRTLQKYEILDTPPDGTFDGIVELAAKLLDMPVVIVSLVDSDRIWFKSHYGLDANQLDLELGLCASAILSDDLYLVEDAFKDPRTMEHSLVTGAFGLRFYAAVPLKTVDGFNLGTFCILDKKPRQLTELQKEILHSLSAIVMNQLELRLAARKANAQQQQLLDMAMHDLRNPLTTIAIRAELIQQSKEVPLEFQGMAGKIKETTVWINRIIGEMLETAGLEAGKITLKRKKLDLSALAGRVISTNQALADNKNQLLQLETDGPLLLSVDENKMFEITDNLINNAIKYSPRNKNITIRVQRKNNVATLEVEDEGPGFTDQDKTHLFHRFSRLSAQPTAGEHSTGLGLSIVKTLVEAHGGQVWVDSEGRDKGALVKVELPILGSE